MGLRSLNDGMNCHCERSEAIQFLNRWILKSDIVKMLLEFLPRSQSFGKGTLFQEPQSVRNPA